MKFKLLIPTSFALMFVFNAKGQTIIKGMVTDNKKIHWPESVLV
ncbi:MAG TPA: hypothetical protein VF487_00515 [Chitinophagaceae bacterium]